MMTLHFKEEYIITRITSALELPIGKIVYHVYGYAGRQTKVNASRVSKLVVLSKPYAEDLGGFKAYFIHVLKVNSDGSSYKTHYSLGDMGIMHMESGSRKPHNLNRIMPTMEDALAFQLECQKGVFTYPEDQEYIATESSVSVYITDIIY